MACAGNSCDQGLGTVESLRYRLKEEISSQERYSFDISITKKYLLKYVVQRRDQKQPLEGTELDKTLESAKIIVDLLSSKMLIDWSGKEAVELIFGCLRILIKVSPSHQTMACHVLGLLLITVATPGWRCVYGVLAPL